MQAAGPGRAHPIFLVMQPRAAFPRLMISGLRLFSKRHPAASRALATAFDRRHPDCSNRFPTMCLQTLPRSRIRPAIRVRGRGRSAFGPCWSRSGGRGPRRLPPELRPADGAVRPIREDAEEGTSAEFRILAREVGKREGATAVPATGCCFKNMRRPDFLDWRAGHAAAQPKKAGCTRAECICCICALKSWHRHSILRVEFGHGRNGRVRQTGL